MNAFTGFLGSKVGLAATVVGGSPRRLLVGEAHGPRSCGGTVFASSGMPVDARLRTSPSTWPQARDKSVHRTSLTFCQLASG